MPRLRRNSPQRLEWTDSHITQLQWGTDDFNEAWGNHWDSLNLDERHTWPGEEILAEMKQCFAECREDVLNKQLCNFPPPRPTFAELVFEQGVLPYGAIRHTSDSRGESETTK